MHKYVEVQVDEQKKDIKRKSEVVVSRKLASGVQKIFQEASLNRKQTPKDKKSSKALLNINIQEKNDDTIEEEDEEAIEQNAKQLRLLAISKKFSIRSMVKQQDAEDRKKLELKIQKTSSLK